MTAQVSREGVVKSFGPRGYGFILSGGDEIFVHTKDCHPREPVAGDRVVFVLGKKSTRDGRVCARSVRIV
jgi:cold shock CspA family protein